MHKAKPAPIIVSVRYSLRHPRIKSLIPKHQKDLSDMMMEQTRSPLNVRPLLKYIGISGTRWANIISGSEPTLGEAIRYADYYKLELASIYEKLPVKK